MSGRAKAQSYIAPSGSFWTTGTDWPGNDIPGVGEALDRSGIVDDTSPQAAGFNISAAQFTLQGTGKDDFTWTGVDLGANSAGYKNNFAIGVFELQSGGSLDIFDSNATGSLANSVETQELDGGLGQLSSFTGNGANVYYDASNAANAYLDDGAYALDGDGSLISEQDVPEPGTGAFLFFGALVFGGLLLFGAGCWRVAST
jgi:hypothetical protein